MLEVGKAIAYRSYRAGGHGYIGANAQDEEHEEEKYREDLWQLLKLGYGIGIRYKCESGATFDHLTNVVRADLVRQVSQYAKDGEAGQ